MTVFRRGPSRSGPEVLVVGGGIVGLACARELALEGFAVEVVERLPAGSEASLAAAGMLAPLSEARPPDHPLLAACRAARDLWHEWLPALEAESGLAIDHDWSGTLLLALDEEGEERLAATERAAHAAGEPVEGCELAALPRWLPGVSPAVRRALLLRGEHRVDNVQACAALALACERQGVKLSYGVAIERIERGGAGVRLTGHEWEREAALLVVAAGAWSGALPGLPALPVRPVRGQMLRLEGIGWPWRGAVREGRLYAVRRGESGLLVGATVEEAGFDAYPTVGGIAELLGFTRRVFPGLADARLESVWAGLRPGTPDGLPLVGPLPEWPALLATGHFRNGILLAPWTARAIAAMATGGASPELAFSPARWAPNQV
jgi:glycine oxidase